MTFKFLIQSPTKTETKEKLLEIVSKKTDGRIFLLTGNVSAQNDDIAADMLLSLIEWAAASKNRELIVWVGVWVDFNELAKARTNHKNSNSKESFKHVEDEYLTTKKVAADLATLYVQAEEKYMRRQPPPEAINLDIQFFGVKKWHAKAVGLTGNGKRFKEAECAIFGSTNFSANALGGKSYELDLYMDRENESDGGLLEAFISKIAPLIEEAKNNHMVSGFNELVFEKITEERESRRSKISERAMKQTPCCSNK